MARSNGGIIGTTNQSSFGKCTVTTTIATGSTTLTTQPGTRVVIMRLLAVVVEEETMVVEVVEQSGSELYFVHLFQLMDNSISNYSRRRWSWRNSTKCNC
jgi:hypothetical protein